LKFALFLSLCAFGLIFAVLPNADAAVDMFLKIDDIEGESQDSEHKGEIEILAWSWGMTQSGSTHVGGGGTAGEVNFQDLSFTKFTDKSSPIILLHAANGEHFVEAKLVVRKAGTTPIEFEIITMTNVLVASISIGGSSGQDRLTENITLNFEKVTIEYTEQDLDGKAAGKSTFEWNIVENTGGASSDGGSGGPGPAPPCSPPASGDWTVSSTCTMTGDATANGNVIVPNGVVLTIPNGVTLDINFATKNLTVQAGGGVLIQAGGTIT